MTHPIGIDRLSVFDLPPVALVELVADLGGSSVGLGMASMRAVKQDFPEWSLKTDAGMRADLVQTAADRGVTIALCEGFGLTRGVEARDYAADLDLVQELGCHRINVVSSGRDLDRSVHGFAVLAEMGAERDIEVVIELGAGPVSDLTAAVTAVEQVDRPNFRILLDTMHFFRFGGTLEGLAAVDPSLIGYVQLCDVPLVSTFDTYMDEAFFERLPPGEGELPLVEVLRLVPPDVVVSCEIPQRTRIEAGESLEGLIGHLLDQTRAVLAQV